MQKNVFVVTPIKTKQCARYSTFTPPPLDGSCTFPETVDWHFQHSPDHVVYTYPEGDTLATINWAREARAIYRAAHVTLSHAEKATATPRFAILAVSDAITYVTVLAGVVRAGYSPFLPSPRVSAQVLGQLLDAAGVTHVFYSSDAATTDLAQHGTAHRNDIVLIPMPTFEDLFPRDESEVVEAPPPVKPNIFDPAAIIHSSGSTNVPKLMPVSHFTWMLAGISPWNNDIDIGGLIMNYSAAPMYHLLGLTHALYMMYCGSVTAVFPPVKPPILPRAENVVANIVETGSAALMLMPSILEAISSDPDNVEKLRSLEFVMFGGAVLKKSSGDILVDHGVRLLNGWGMSEIGMGTACFAKTLGKDWQWMRLASYVKPVYRDLGDGTYELILISHEGHHLDRPNHEINGQRAVATSDVVIRHPTEPSLFQIVGRLDDQIVLNTGEKTNAIPLEGILRSDPKVDHAVYFGRSRPHNGVIVMPSPEHKFDPVDAERLARFREDIWPTVVKMNEFAPSHSRLVKEMILVASPSKPFAINGTKNTAVRAQVTTAYADEIDKAYVDFELTGATDFSPPVSWDLEQVTLFIRTVVRSSIPVVRGDDEDLFNIGCDSLRAARIHNSIARALQASGLSRGKIVADTVYKFPTIRLLSKYVSDIGLDVGPSLSVKTAEVERILEKYSQGFPTHRGSVAFDGKDLYILITGTTGGLGTNLLAQLLAAPNVSKVYALNRAGSSGTSLLSRHKSSFLDRGVDPALLNSEKFILLEGDTTRGDLGIPTPSYDEIVSKVTHIIHNAWPVNFNYSIATFESAIKGARNLVDLALNSKLSTPPRMIFISSISVSRNAGSPASLAPEEQILDPAIVVGQGYPESKWVVERVLQIASEKTALRAVSIRVGQLAGGTSGCWNVSDWVPVIVRSAAVLGCLPECATDIYWMRLDEATSSILDMRDAIGILHLVHPQPVAWAEVFKVFAESLNVPIVSFHEWLERVENYGIHHPNGGQEVPALRLLEFYKGLGQTGFESMSRTENVAINKAKQISPSLHDMQRISDGDVRKWLQYWRRAGVIG